jgi:hypothetical protein
MTIVLEQSSNASIKFHSPTKCLHNISTGTTKNASIKSEEDASMSDEVTGKAKGGVAAAAKLSPEERSERAKNAAAARWSHSGEGLPKVTHRGELTIGTQKIPCAVLDNGKRVISETGLSHALLGSRSGASRRQKKQQEAEGSPIPVFLAPINLKPFIPSDLDAGPLAPIVYQDKGRAVYGFEATLLPAVCDIWLRAREAGALQKQQLDKAQNAEILMRGLAHVGIIALIDEATGYQSERSRDALQELLAIYLSEEKLKWAKMFPDEFYRQVFRLQGWNYNPLDNRRPKVVGKLTNDVVYKKLPPGVLDKLRELNPVKNKKTWRRSGTHTQFLSEDVGQQDLRDHFLQIMPLMRASKTWSGFIKLLEIAMPDPAALVEGTPQEFDF